MNTTKVERLKTLQKQNGLTKDHFFKSPQGFTIITREGIEVVQTNRDIRVSFDVVTMSEDLKHVVLKAIGEMPRQGGSMVRYETFGESAPYNTRQKYPIAMAEKRALSRIVLKLSGFYEMGVFGQDESDDFVKVANVKPKPIVKESESKTLVKTWLTSGNASEEQLNKFKTNPKYAEYKNDTEIQKLLEDALNKLKTTK